MTFTSLQFVLFFPTVVALYWLAPSRWRWAILLLASCLFYMAFIPQYILILFFLIAIDYTMARLIERATGAARRRYLWVSIGATLAILFVFKYFNFFNVNIEALAQLLHWNYSIGALRLILPLGLSFHTFQSLSYVIEVYRGKYPAERHLGLYALYVMFFPQLIAGPIERPQHLLRELHETPRFSRATAMSGVRLMLWGFFKKLVIADRLALSVDYIWAHAAAASPLSIAAAIVFFAFELYADFSAYSDIARGSARILGIDIMLNFDRPFSSTSIAEFWRRWHISLSTWFRDYVFYPVLWKERRWGRLGEYFSILITFLLIGIWHGAGWTYIIMGLMQGFFIVVGRITKKVREQLAMLARLAQVPRLRQWLARCITFALMSFSWMFFRAPDLSTAILFVQRLFAAPSIQWSTLPDAYFAHPFLTLGFSQSDLMIAGGGIILMLAVEAMQVRETPLITFNRQPLILRSFTYSSVVLAILIFGVFTAKQFIYFQF